MTKDIKEVLDRLMDKALSDMDDGVLSVHVSCCHDTKIEIEQTGRVRAWYCAYMNALFDVAKELGIPLDTPEE